MRCVPGLRRPLRAARRYLRLLVGMALAALLSVMLVLPAAAESPAPDRATLPSSAVPTPLVPVGGTADSGHRSPGR